MHPQSNDAPPIASDVGLPRAKRRGGFAKPLLFGVKLLITAACFWLVLRRVDVSGGFRALPRFDYRWAGFAVLVLVAEIPLVALRIRAIVQVLARDSTRLTFAAANAVTAICGFFGQVVPGVVGEGIRAWFLVRLGCSWREALTSVTIDRCVGVGALFAFSFVILLLPSPLNALAGYRDVVMVGFGGALVVGVLALVFAAAIASFLRLWRYSSWIASFPVDARRVLFGRKAASIFTAAGLLHGMTIVAVWAVSRALGFSLSAHDCAVLFSLMVGVAIIPISVGGWGLRELAVVSLLDAHGVAAEAALMFSLCFGAVVLVSALPGGVVWLLYLLPENDGHAPV